MKTIFKSEILDCEGRAVEYYEFFENEDDAKNFAWGGETKPPMNPNRIIEINIWQHGEYSFESAEKQRILSKLTIDERKKLGF